MANLKVGILLPVFNAEKYIKESLDSALNQTYGNYKVYLTDDGSTDSCPKIYEEYKNNKKFDLVILDKNMGNPVAMNTSAQRAIDDGCDFVYIFAADDIMQPNALEALINKQSETKCDFVLSWIEFIGSRRGVHQPGEGVTYERNIRGNQLIGFVLYKAKDWERLGGYTEAFLRVTKSSWEDYEMLCKALKHGLTYAVVKEPLIKYRIHEGQVTNVMTKKHNELVKVFHELHPL